MPDSHDGPTIQLDEASAGLLDALTERWLAVAGPGDYVRLLPAPGAIGPDVFVKLASVTSAEHSGPAEPSDNPAESFTADVAPAWEAQRAPGPWAIVEIMGHRVVAGSCSDATLAGAAFLQVQHPTAADHAGALPGPVGQLHLPDVRQQAAGPDLG